MKQCTLSHPNTSASDFNFIQLSAFLLIEFSSQTIGFRLSLCTYIASESIELHNCDDRHRQNIQCSLNWITIVKKQKAESLTENQ